MESKVAVVDSGSFNYPQIDTEFRPSRKYPEIEKLGLEYSEKDNPVYEAVRECLYLLGFDSEHYGERNWNPLGKLIKPGDNVLIKPNLVMDHNQNPQEGIECLYTHPSVVAPVIDYVLLALQGVGKVIIGDAPMQECNFEIIGENGYYELISYYKKKDVDIELVDFRELKSKVINGILHNEVNERSCGTIIDLGEKSEFSSLDKKEISKLRITNYDPRVLNEHHSINKHEYYISKYLLEADVVINMPKPKTHRKAGATMSLKNMIGINTRKEYLPHHTKGSMSEGGDEYLYRNSLQSIRSWLLDLRNMSSSSGHYHFAYVLQVIIRVISRLMLLNRNQQIEGNWWGNNTISKTISDINKLVFYADKEGAVASKRIREMLIIGDMIVSGEKEGPVCPSKKNVGYIVAGTNPVCFDEAIATIMGFDIKKIPALKCVRSIKKLMIAEKDQCPIIVSNVPKLNGLHIDEISEDCYLRFIPSAGWKGNLELD